MINYFKDKNTLSIPWIESPFFYSLLENSDLTDEGILNADFNQDNVINVLDVVGIVNLILNGGQVDSMPDFSLEDINPASDYYGEYIGTQTFRDDISLYYFGKAG